MRIYKNFCKTKSDILTDVQSQLYLPDGRQIQSVTMQSGLLQIQTNSGIDSFQLESCSEFGDVSLLRSDMTSLAWVVLFVFASAWAIKILKRGF